MHLVISDERGQAEALFSPENLGDERYVRECLLSLWGLLLQLRTRELLDLLGQSETALEGEEAWEEIVNALGKFEEQKGKKPTVLKLPIKYAVALMKLGPSYWGDFFPKIRESGIRAFEKEPLLGMQVQLVPGVDAKLELEAAERAS